MKPTVDTARQRATSRLGPSVRMVALAALCIVARTGWAQSHDDERPRARDLGVTVGVFPVGQYNAITDVPGVRVGHSTAISGDSVNTGVTVILPHSGNLYHNPVRAAVHVANGYGKMLGIAQVQELGVLETPIALTCTLCVWRVADALTDYYLRLEGMESVRSINAVVGETNDGYLNDIRNKPVSRDHVVQAIEHAASGPVAEGSVGAGRGTIAFGWKGGIGTSSRIVPMRDTTYAVGVLVQSNFGGILSVAGAPVGKEMDQYAFRRSTSGSSADGSIMIVVATDAPLDARQLRRLSHRAMLGVGRAGGAMTHGSGDFVIAFSTEPPAVSHASSAIPDGALSPFFQAVAEATEESVYNSLFRATAVDGHRGRIEAIDLGRVAEILRKYGVLE